MYMALANTTLACSQTLLRTPPRASGPLRNRGSLRRRRRSWPTIRPTGWPILTRRCGSFRRRLENLVVARGRPKGDKCQIVSRRRSSTEAHIITIRDSVEQPYGRDLVSKAAYIDSAATNVKQGTKDLKQKAKDKVSDFKQKAKERAIAKLSGRAFPLDPTNQFGTSDLPPTSNLPSTSDFPPTSPNAAYPMNQGFPQSKTAKRVSRVSNAINAASQSKQQVKQWAKGTYKVAKQGLKGVAKHNYEAAMAEFSARAVQSADRGGGSSGATGGASGTLGTRHLDEDDALVARDIFEEFDARYFDEIDELD